MVRIRFHVSRFLRVRFHVGRSFARAEALITGHLRDPVSNVDKYKVMQFFPM